jgi:hypothetical protein
MMDLNLFKSFTIDALGLGFFVEYLESINSGRSCGRLGYCANVKYGKMEEVLGKYNKK